MNLKALYQRFRAWQLEPYRFECESEKTHKCFNCGEEFEGNYCPVCGQYYNEGPVAWSPEEKAPSRPLWGLLEPGSILSFFLQLLGRPGYMIGDYLKGRKQVTGSPIENLCYAAIGAALILSLTGNDSNGWIQSADGGLGLMGICLAWMSSHLDYAALIQTALLILPTWALFRFAPRHPHHTLKEGFFIQAFMASLVLICIMLRALIADWLILLVPICNFVVYRQLFGYGIWGTLWRTILSIGIVFYIFAVLMVTARYLQGELPANHSAGTVVAMDVMLLAVGLGTVLIGYLIGKKTAHKG